MTELLSPCSEAVLCPPAHDLLEPHPARDASLCQHHSDLPPCLTKCSPHTHPLPESIQTSHGLENKQRGEQEIHRDTNGPETQQLLWMPWYPGGGAKQGTAPPIRPHMWEDRHCPVLGRKGPDRGPLLPPLPRHELGQPLQRGARQEIFHLANPTSRNISGRSAQACKGTHAGIVIPTGCAQGALRSECTRDQWAMCLLRRTEVTVAASFQKFSAHILPPKNRPAQIVR